MSLSKILRSIIDETFNIRAPLESKDTVTLESLGSLKRTPNKQPVELEAENEVDYTILQPTYKMRAEQGLQYKEIEASVKLYLEKCVPKPHLRKVGKEWECTSAVPGHILYEKATMFRPIAAYFMWRGGILLQLRMHKKIPQSWVDWHGEQTNILAAKLEKEMRNVN